MPDVFADSYLKPFENFFHRTAIRLRQRRWSQPLAWLMWASWMVTHMFQNPTLGWRMPAVLMRQMSWQIWCRTVKSSIVAEMSGGYNLVLPPWSKLAGMTFATGLHEPREELFVLAYLRPGDVAVDVGANIGIYSTLIGSTGASVIAFEPGSRSRKDLARTLALNPSMAVTVVPAALSDQCGQMGFTTNLEGANHLTEARAEDDLENVDVLRLDDYLITNPVELAFIKVDAEGFDLQVLKGAESAITNQQPVVLVETWGPSDVREWLEARGYRTYRYAFEDRTLHEYPRSYSDEANVVAIHDDRVGHVLERLSAAPEPRTKLPRVKHLHI
jgi:FkbM family methyltransferase